MSPQPMSAEDEAAIRDHLAIHRQALRTAVATTVRACRGTLIGDVAVGMDPGVDDPSRRWWARVTLHGGRSGHSLYAEGCGSALEALEHLNPKIRHHLRTARRRR